MVSHAHREEKGSDVNVGAHMLLDVLQGHMDAAMVFSNDSDLAFPVREARQRVPVGTVNPSTSPTAGKLKGTPADWCVHYMHAELGLPPRVIAEQMGWTLAGVLKLLAVYGHGDVGALEEVDKAFGANVTELRAVDSAASGMHGGPDAAS
jgi:hypothetical protein